MKQIYIDNSATSFPKAPGVAQATMHFLEHSATNLNRSGFSEEFAAEELVFETRNMLCELFHFPKAENIVFTLNATGAMNYILKGLLKKGDHCLVSEMEHNAVMRPLSQLAQLGVEYSKMPCNIYGELELNKVQKQIKANTKAMIVTHASNVCGTILPIEELGRLCSEHGLYFIIDSAQTAGILPIGFEALKASAIVFAGHKGLLGPQGTGGAAISEELAKTLEPLVSGGTGSASESEDQPSFMPDKFEAGTMNLPGIAGLNSALTFINNTGIEAIRQKEESLCKTLLHGFAKLEGIKLLGLKTITNRVAVISIDCLDKDNADVAYALYKHYGIRTRCGLHCAPSAHKALGSFPKGSIRFSPGFFNTEEEIDFVIASLKEVLKK